MMDYSFRPIFLHCRSLYYHDAPQQPKQARFTAAWMGLFFFWRVDLRPKFTMQSLHNQLWIQTYSPKKKRTIHAAALCTAGGDSVLIGNPRPHQWAHFLNEWDAPLPRTQRSHTIKQPCYNNGRSRTSQRSQCSSSQASLTSLAKSLGAWDSPIWHCCSSQQCDS